MLSMLLLLGQQCRVVLAQQPPCPPPGPPEWAVILDTQAKCNCFYALAAQDLGDISIYESVYSEDSELNFPQAGSYSGPGGIGEYVAFGSKGEFISDITTAGFPIFLDFTSTGEGQCVATLAERILWNLNPVYTQDNQEACVDVVTGVKLYYTLTGNQAAPINIQTQDIWFPDALIADGFSLLVDTPATADFICDVNVNTCGNVEKSLRSSKSLKSSKSFKSSKSVKSSSSMVQNKAIKNCLNKLNDLPSFTTEGSLTYMDGNSKGCRMLHSFLALSNDVHCPHVSFEAEEDVNGSIKCIDSKGRLPSDLFTEDEIGLFHYASTLLGLGESASEIRMEACSLA